MEFFDKIRNSLSSPLKNPENQPIKTWNIQISSGSFTEENVRLLLFRECDRRGRKCLYDSSNVIRDKCGKFSYIPPKDPSELLEMNEWIFGSVPLSSNSTKRFHRKNGKFLWSQVFTPTRNRFTKFSSSNSSGPSLSCNNNNSNSSEFISNGFLSSNSMEDSFETKSIESNYSNFSSISSSSSSTSFSPMISNFNISFSSTKSTNSGGTGAGSGSESSSLTSSISQNQTPSIQIKSNCLSLPIMNRERSSNSNEMKACLSLPSKLENSTSSSTGSSCSFTTNPSGERTSLGLAILIYIPKSSVQNNCDNLGTLEKYLLKISWSLESACDWFATVASSAYSNPTQFVQTLYPFSSAFRSLFVSRVNSPLISPLELSPSFKILNNWANSSVFQNLLLEFLSLLLSVDLGWTKRGNYPANRARIIITGSYRKLPEVKSLLYFLKIVLLSRCLWCSRSSKINSPKKSSPPLILEDPPARDNKKEETLNSNSNSTNNLFLNAKNDNDQNNSNISTNNNKTKEKEEVGVECLSLNPEDFNRKFENMSLVTKESRDDSGIDLMLSHSSTASSNSAFISQNKSSMRRTPSFINSINNFRNNSDLLSTCSSNLSDVQGRDEGSPPKILQSERGSSDFVSFHLGEESDCDQTFNNLSLSEPMPEKLLRNTKKETITSAAVSGSFMEHVDLFSKVEKIEIESPQHNPINVELDLDETEPLRKSGGFCSYCDSLGIVDKFSPFYYLQWIKTSCTPDLSQENWDLMQSTGHCWIIVNLDKPGVKFLGIPEPQHQSQLLHSALVENLLKQVWILVGNSRLNEIEEFCNLQLDFIWRLGEDFGTRLDSLPTADHFTADLNFLVKELHITQSDLPILFSIAKKKVPRISQRYFLGSS